MPSTTSFPSAPEYWSPNDGALVLGELGDVVGPELALLVGGRLLREEEVPEAAVEQLGRAAGGLDVQHPVALGDRGGG